jgi:hypothetical protein
MQVAPMPVAVPPAVALPALALQLLSNVPPLACPELRTPPPKRRKAKEERESPSKKARPAAPTGPAMLQPQAGGWLPSPSTPALPRPLPTPVPLAMPAPEPWGPFGLPTSTPTHAAHDAHGNKLDGADTRQITGARGRGPVPGCGCQGTWANAIALGWASLHRPRADAPAPAPPLPRRCVGPAALLDQEEQQVWAQAQAMAALEVEWEVEVKPVVDALWWAFEGGEPSGSVSFDVLQSEVDAYLAAQALSEACAAQPEAAPGLLEPAPTATADAAVDYVSLALLEPEMNANAAAQELNQSEVGALAMADPMAKVPQYVEDEIDIYSFFV